VLAGLTSTDFLLQKKQPGIQLELVVVGLHVLAQPVKRLVVVLLAQVGEFMHGNHIQ
jgi:hypothetical protein